jgi:NADH:ubiquinone oxidoreductase subunit 6 (subunit J)
LEDPVGFCASAKVFGMSLFTKYLLLVQVSGFLLLIAIAGVVHLAKNNPSKGPSC